MLTLSFYTNMKSILNTKKRPGADQLYVINGMRFMSMSWIIVGHTYDFTQWFIHWTNEWDALHEVNYDS